MLIDNLRRKRLRSQQGYLDHQFSRKQKQKHNVHMRNSALVDTGDEVQIEGQQLYIA